MPNPEKMIKKMRGRNKKLAGMSDNKAAAPKGPDMSAFAEDMTTAMKAVGSAKGDTVRQGKAKAMFKKIKRKYGIK